MQGPFQISQTERQGPFAYNETPYQGPQGAPQQGPRNRTAPRTRAQRIDQFMNIGRRMAPGFNNYTKGAYVGTGVGTGIVGLDALILIDRLLD